MIRTLTLLILAALITSCTSFSPALNTEAKPNPAMGYIYGRFTFVQSEKTFTHLHMGVRLEELNQKKSYTLQFIQEDRPAIIAVAPGMYSIKKLIFSSAEYEKLGEKILKPSPLTQTFLVSAGKAYYIGDFGGEWASIDGLNAPGISWKRQAWRLNRLHDRFEYTTQDLKSHYPNLQSLEFIHALTISLNNSSRADRHESQ